MTQKYLEDLNIDPKTMISNTGKTLRFQRDIVDDGEKEA